MNMVKATVTMRCHRPVPRGLCFTLPAWVWRLNDVDENISLVMLHNKHFMNSVK